MDRREKIIELLCKYYPSQSPDGRLRLTDKILALESQECLGEEEIDRILNEPTYINENGRLKLLWISSPDKLLIAKKLAGKIARTKEYDCEFCGGKHKPQAPACTCKPIETDDIDCPIHGQKPEKQGKVKNLIFDWDWNAKDVFNKINELVDALNRHMGVE